jgi:PAS domain S-box-containing protein
LDASGIPKDYRFLDVNPAFERLTDRKIGSLQGRLASEAMPEQEYGWLARFGEVAMTGQPTEFESYSVATRRHYHITSFSPRVGVFAMILEDVTEREVIGEELLGQKERYEALLENLQEGIWEIDSSGVTTFTNKHVSEMLGYATEEIAGRPFYDFMNEEAAAQVDLRLERRRSCIVHPCPHIAGDRFRRSPQGHVGIHSRHL